MCILYPAACKKDFQPASILEITWKACEGSPHAGRCGGSKVCINTCRTWVALWTWHRIYNKNSRCWRPHDVWVWTRTHNGSCCPKWGNEESRFSGWSRIISIHDHSISFRGIHLLFISQKPGLNQVIRVPGKLGVCHIFVQVMQWHWNIIIHEFFLFQCS